MVKYELCCELGHQFEGWFRDDAQFRRQQYSGLLTCPICECPGVSQMVDLMQSEADQCGDEYSEEYQRTKYLLQELNNYIDQDGLSVAIIEHDRGAETGFERVKALHANGLSAIAFEPSIDKNKLN